MIEVDERKNENNIIIIMTVIIRTDGDDYFNS